jgi:hypothetical protein
MTRIVALVLGVLVVLASAPAWADSNARESTWEQAGYGAGSFLGSLVYTPVKGVFCILGGIGSGAAFVAGGTDAAAKVAGSACGGTWLITPSVLKGKEELRFIGEAPRRDPPPQTQ